MTKQIFLPLILWMVLLQCSPVEAKDNHLDPVVLQLKWLHQFQFAGYYAAIEKGFYRDVGLNVLLQEAQPGLDITGELSSGRAQYLVNNPSALLERAQGEPVVALAAIFQHSPLVLASLKQSQILTPTDLLGKRTMLIPETESELVAMFINEGISLERIDIQPHSWDVADLVSEKVMAMSAYLTDAPFLLKQYGAQTSLLRPLTYGIDFYGDVLFTSSRELKAHPERVKAFRAASLKGWSYAMENPEEIVDLILSKYKSRLTRDALLFEAQAMRPLILPQLVEMGHMNPGRWQHIAKTYIALGLLPDNFSLEGFLYRPEEKTFWTSEVMLGVIIVLAFCTFSVLVLLLFNIRLRLAVQTRTKELQDSEKNLRLLADSMPQLVWSADSTGTVDYYNERRAEFRGFSQRSDGSWEWAPVLHPDDAETTVKAWKTAYQTGTLYEVEHRVQRSDGEYAWFLSRAKPNFDEAGNILRWYGTTTDIDALKRTEMALAEAKKTAEAANHVKSEFLAKVSHEIRTPMTVFISAIEHLLEAEKDPVRLQILDLADLSSRRLHALIEEIFDYTKIDRHKMVLIEDQFELRKCFQNAINLMREKATQKNLLLELDLPPESPKYFYGDEHRLSQILLNLIGNGIKFTDEGYVKVVVRCDRQNLTFRVIDTGIGIPDEMIEDIFEAFFQADNSSTRRHGGAGLGLSIVKGMLELMRGTIKVKSALGQGSTFIVTIPLKPKI